MAKRLSGKVDLPVLSLLRGRRVQTARTDDDRMHVLLRGMQF
jgi:hypothetical protein